MLVLVKCPNCNKEFEDCEEVFHLSVGGGDTNIVRCDKCDSVFNVSLCLKNIEELKEDRESETEAIFGSESGYWAWKTK